VSIIGMASFRVNIARFDPTMLVLAERMSSLLTALVGYVPVVQVVLAILVVGGVLLQTRGAGLGAFADSTNQTYYKRRGGELFLFRATIIAGVLFVLTALLSLLIR